MLVHNDGVEQRLEARLDSFEQCLNTKIESVRSDLSARMGNIETKLDWLIRLIGIVGFIFAAVNFFHFHST